MALSSVFDPFFSSSIFDPLDHLSLVHFDRGFPDKDVNAVANTRIDWVETSDAHVFKADLPGLKKEEIKVHVTPDGVLRISGERTREKLNKKCSYRKVERSFGKFQRQVKLPKNTKPQEISAKVENGVLTVTVPKTEEAKKAEVRTVEVTG